MTTELLIVTDTYFPNIDGIVVFLKNVLPKIKTDFTVHILAPNFGKKEEKWETLLDLSKLGYAGHPFIKFSLKNIKRIITEIRHHHLIWIQGTSLLSFITPFIAKKSSRVVYSIHVIPWEAYEALSTAFLWKNLRIWVIKKAAIFNYNLCDEILIPYHDLKTHLLKEGVRTKMSVARLGVDIDRFSPSKEKSKSKEKINLNPNKMVIGYVGRISKEKNIKVLREAFKRLPGQGHLHLLMVGDGPEDQTRDFKSMSNCTVTGFVNNVPDYLRAMDIFVMPSLTETTSLATLEAMSCGLPVIATQVGFIKNYLIKEENGLFFPRNSPALLAAKIEKVRHNKHLAQKLGENARKTVAYSFSWDRSINKITRILLEERS